MRRLVFILVVLGIVIAGLLAKTFYERWELMPVTINIQAKAFCTDPEHRGNRYWGIVPVKGTIERKWAKVYMEKKMVLETCPQCQEQLERELRDEIFLPN